MAKATQALFMNIVLKFINAEYNDSWIMCLGASSPGLLRICRRCWKGLRYTVCLSFLTPQCGGNQLCAIDA
jgi:hypothetical protein